MHYLSRVMLSYIAFKVRIIMSSKHLLADADISITVWTQGFCLCTRILEIDRQRTHGVQVSALRSKAPYMWT